MILFERINKFVKDNKWILVFLCSIPFFNDSYYSISNYYFIDTGLELSKIIVVLILSFFLIKKKQKPSSLTLVLFLIELWWMATTIINYGLSDSKLLYKVFIDNCNAIGMALIVESFKDDSINMIKGLMLNFELAIYPNFVSVIAKNIPGDRQFLLGFYSVLILWFLPAICISILYMIQNKKYTRSIILIVISILSAAIIKCATITVVYLGITMIVLLGVAFSKVKGKRKHKILLSVSIIIAVLLNIFVLFIYNAGSYPFIDMFIEVFLNRSTTFTGRIPIWSSAINAIKIKPLIGYGGRTELFVPTYGINVLHCHNQLLQRLYITGIIGLLLFGLFHIVLVNKIDRIKDSFARTVMIASCFGIALTYITEAYKKFFRFYLVFFLAYHIDEIIENAFNNKDYLLK